MLTTFWLHFGWILATFWLHSDYILITFWPHSDYILITFWLQFDYNLTTFWLHSDYILTTLWLHSDYILTTFWLRSDYIHNISNYDELGGGPSRTFYLLFYIIYVKISIDRKWLLMSDATFISDDLVWLLQQRPLACCLVVSQVDWGVGPFMAHSELFIGPVGELGRLRIPVL